MNKESSEQKNQQPQHQNNFERENNNKFQWLTRKNKYRKDRSGQILGEVNKNKDEDLQMSNSFNALKDKEDKKEVNVPTIIDIEEQKKDHAEVAELSTKDWVNKSFGKVNIQEAEKGEPTNNKSDKEKENQQKDDQQDESAQK
ncbi:hypothetical protein FXO37_26183 [Capsicum annuum]|nr:hypothetical protein FXO37_26183 [Capsicum annuum]